MRPCGKSKALCTVHGKGSLQIMGIGFDPCGDRQAQLQCPVLAACISCTRNTME